MSQPYHSHHVAGDAQSACRDRRPYDHDMHDCYGDRPPHGYQAVAQAHPTQRRANAAPDRPQKAAPSDRRRAEYTFAHAGRLLRLRPLVFWSGMAALLLMSGWSIMTAMYFAFHDDVLARLIAHEAAMQSAYEDRIAEMRVQVDRVTSRQLIDQEQFEQQLQQLLRRQAALESRSATLGTVTDPLVTGSIKSSVRSNADLRGTGARKPSAKDASNPSSEQDARLELRPRPTNPARTAANSATGNIARTLANVQDALNRVEMRQANSLNAIEEGYDAKAHRMRGVLADLGLDRATTAATGGPFVALKPRGDANGFERQLYRINLARAQVDQLSRVLAAVPVRRPVFAELDATSGFGVRVDPFLGRPAMHTGVDFRGSVGDPIRVTAGGTVVHAGWSGGYGEMVEVDHGNGLSTRYGHLSQIEVVVGDTVKAGEIIGRLGSSGRSTGPHLHYETRVEGEAVDPERFLRAGGRLDDAS